MDIKLFDQAFNLRSVRVKLSPAAIIFMVLLFLSLAEGSMTAQVGGSKRKGTSKLDTHKGYITVNDLTYGYGLSVTDAPYANSYLGFTTIQGYQINKNFVFGGGLGFHVYDAGKALPLFLDFRYRFYTARALTSYAFADGGFLFKLGSEDKTTELFLNPGIGVRHDFSKDVGGNLGVGIMIQQGPSRNSFVNIKLGVTIKP
jgi:hypothetical protein